MLCKQQLASLRGLIIIIQNHNLRFCSGSHQSYGLEKKWAHYNQKAVTAEAEKPTRLLTPTKLMFAGKSSDGRHLMKSVRFLQSELPRRIARRVIDFQSLPYVVAINPNIQHVYELYLRAFHKLSAVPPIQNLEEEKRYSDLIQRLLNDHQNVISCLAKAFREVKHQIPYEVLGSLTERTIKSRLGIRMLAEHHVSLRHDKEDFIGIICTRTSPKRIIEKCVYNNRRMCEHTLGLSPSVFLSGHTKSCFPHFPSVLEYILQELLKNSMKATVLNHKTSKKSMSSELPPLEVTICNNDEHFIIKISDRGGGIPESRLEEIFRYSVTSTPEEDENRFNEGGMFDSFVNAANVKGVGGHISGDGFGLPSSRAYTEFLGGRLSLMPMVGLGSDTFLKISHITSDQIKI